MIIKGKLIIPRNLASSVTEPNEIGRYAFHLPEETGTRRRDIRFGRLGDAVKPISCQ
jgi:hypothetical protein